MMINTNTLSYIALDYAVAQCQKVGYWDKPEKFLKKYMTSMSFCRFHRDWAMSGEIIENELIELVPFAEGAWDALKQDQHIPNSGSTPLEAAMRCYVASKLGLDVEIPDVIADAYYNEIQAILRMDIPETTEA